MEIYEIKYSGTEQDLYDKFDDCLDVKMVNNSTIQPLPPGETIVADVFIDSGASGNFFIAVRAIGTYGAKVMSHKMDLTAIIFLLGCTDYYRVKYLTLLRLSPKKLQVQSLIRLKVLFLHHPVPCRQVPLSEFLWVGLLSYAL